MNYLILIIFLALNLAFAGDTHADDNGNPLIPMISGNNRVTHLKPGETLMEFALREGYGFENIVKCNPSIDPWLPEDMAEVILPGEVISPHGAAPGIFINLAELRLFHIKKNDTHYEIDTYPLGIGREGRETPEGQHHIIIKKEKPAWRVPIGLRSEDPTLPKIVPPGPQNPLGEFWLGLSAAGYGIHGTNRPLGVGRRISYGCLRMYPQDIEKLYHHVNIGTPVVISYQPVKVAQDGHYLLIEVHPDYLARHENLFQHTLSVISKTGWAGSIDYSRVKAVVNAAIGLPEIIGFAPGK